MTLTLIVTIVLMLIAFGMGLGLDGRHFLNVWRQPRSVAAGLTGQVVLLPVVAAGLASLVDVEVVALGLLLIAVCPGGASSNYMTYLARGDVALSVSLTAVCSFLSVLTVPLVFNGATHMVLGHAVEVTLPVAKTMQTTFLYTVLPVLVGMGVRKVAPGVAGRTAGPVAGAAFLVLLAITPFLVADHVTALLPITGTVLLWVSLLLAFTMSCGYGLAAVAGLPMAQRRTLTVEVGVQNVALALVLALKFFDDPRLVAVPVGYLLAMYIFVPGFVVLSRRTPLQPAVARTQPERGHSQA